MKNFMKTNKAAFFDRDGTLINDINYLSRLEDVVLIPKAVSLCRFLANQGYKIFVVTNQSGIARGFFDEQFVQQTHAHLDALLREQGIAVDGWYYCPHHPETGAVSEYITPCLCRKPMPGMLQKAAHEHNLDLKNSLMFGDKLLDLQAGWAAGCRSFEIKRALQLSDQQMAFLY
ncbi:HAD family hydrolase [Candidatus Babeliales bacterium]|nr:HAD family hydrolase [Candidatus Babeliales bacterium]